MRPTVTEVEVTSDAGADATYALGETLEVTVRFSEAVAVTGAPGLSIDMDPASWGEKRAVYASGSGTASLVFAHEVVHPNYSTRGIAVLGSTLALHGGAIRSASSGTTRRTRWTGGCRGLTPRVATRRRPTPRRRSWCAATSTGRRCGSSSARALDPDATGGRLMMDLSTEPLSFNFPATGAVTVEGAVVTGGAG